MKKISNSSELNQYYGRINNYIDEYISSYRVSPSEIYRYINKNINKFLEKFGLNDIEYIEQIVKDVVEHRRNMEKDKIFKFEQFTHQINESLINLTPGTVHHEKILADYYNTSLGHIKLVDPNVHLYEIKDFDKVIKAVVFSSEEIQLLKTKIQQKISSEIMNMSVELNSLDGQILEQSLDFRLTSIVSNELLSENINSKLNNEVLITFISRLIPHSLLNIGEFVTVDFKEIYKRYYIWEL